MIEGQLIGKFKILKVLVPRTIDKDKDYRSYCITKCLICGVKQKVRLDYVDSIVGCKICNRAKMNMPYKEFISWIRRIKNDY